MPKGVNTRARCKELSPIREFAIREAKSNPSLTINSLREILSKQFGDTATRLPYQTVRNWLNKARGSMPVSATEPKEKPTFEQLIESFSSPDELGEYLVLGFVKIAQERNELRSLVGNDTTGLKAELDSYIQRCKELKGEVISLTSQLQAKSNDYDRLLKLHNESLARAKTGHMTIDTIKRAIIPLR
jgi:hypothetical protein